MLNQQAPPEGVTIALSSEHSNVVKVPQEVKVPGGAHSAMFPITTTVVTAPSSTVITATNAGTTRTATLIVLP
jgi:5-enolpyruvylshikimate-3-phosphate synthase